MADNQIPYTNSPAGLKAKTMDAFRVHVMEPMRRDLLEMQVQLRADGLEDETSRVERALRVLDAELERAKNLRLSDSDVAAPVIGQAAELAAR